MVDHWTRRLVTCLVCARLLVCLVLVCPGTIPDRPAGGHWCTDSALLRHREGDQLLPFADASDEASGDLAARDANHASRLLWLSFWVMFLSVSIGLSWDGGWHLTHPFETAFSPPHLFIYVTSALTVALYVVLLVTPRLRHRFGTPFRVPLIPFAVPGALALIGAGLLLLSLAAMLDIVWHSTFGLDETRWSLPHALLSWAWSTAAIGFVSARLALREHRPLRWWTRAFIGFVLIVFSAGPVMGPLQPNPTQEKLEALAAVPVLASQPAYQHTFRIYRDWNVTRSNVLFPVLGGLWLGRVLSAVRMLDGRPSLLLVLIVMWTVFAAFRDRSAAIRLGIDPTHVASWLPIPLLPATIGAVLAWRLRWSLTLSALLAGAVFGGTSQAVWWSIGIVDAALLGAATCALGVTLGTRLASVIEKPTARRCLVVTMTAFAVPVLSGLVDLYLRLHTQ
jgi:hypothetical protein